MVAGRGISQVLWETGMSLMVVDGGVALVFVAGESPQFFQIHQQLKSPGTHRMTQEGNNLRHQFMKSWFL